MIEKITVYDVKTGKTHIEEIEVPDIKEEEIISQPTLEDKVRELEEVNAMQDELINISLLATDEMFMMLEPIIDTMVLKERGMSKMVEMYVAMIQRGLKTIEEVPARYREQVKEILVKLEK